MELSRKEAAKRVVPLVVRIKDDIRRYYGEDNKTLFARRRSTRKIEEKSTSAGKAPKKDENKEITKPVTAQKTIKPAAPARSENKTVTKHVDTAAAGKVVVMQPVLNTPVIDLKDKVTHMNTSKEQSEMAVLQNKIKNLEERVGFWERSFSTSSAKVKELGELNKQIREQLQAAHTELTAMTTERNDYKRKLEEVQGATNEHLQNCTAVLHSELQNKCNEVASLQHNVLSLHAANMNAVVEVQMASQRAELAEQNAQHTQSLLQQQQEQTANIVQTLQ